MELFEVGGCVRDELLGVKSKDIDFSVVLDEQEKTLIEVTGETPFDFMFKTLVGRQFEVFLATPEFLTIRARFPKGHENSGLTADFVLARKESDYTDNRRPDKVEPGTLLDDLARRDFTMNAIAKAACGKCSHGVVVSANAFRSTTIQEHACLDCNGTGARYIDPFNGRQDITDRIIRCVGDPRERFEEDALRIVRAMRFAVTKDFSIEVNTMLAMDELVSTVAGVSAERVREELTKMFNVNPLETIRILDDFFMLPIIFDMGINFQPTMKERIR